VWAGISQFINCERGADDEGRAQTERENVFPLASYLKIGETGHIVGLIYGLEKQVIPTLRFAK
jgi:hypothetical protein